MYLQSRLLSFTFVLALSSISLPDLVNCSQSNQSTSDIEGEYYAYDGGSYLIDIVDGLEDILDIEVDPGENSDVYRGMLRFEKLWVDIKTDLMDAPEIRYWEFIGDWIIKHIPQSKECIKDMAIYLESARQQADWALESKYIYV